MNARCRRGHELVGDNVIHERQGQLTARRCRQCRREWKTATTHSLTCPHCGEARAVTRAMWNEVRTGRSSARCTRCAAFTRRLYRTRKTCRTCGQNKPLDAFYKSSRQHDGRDSRCADCTRHHLAALSVADPWRSKISSHDHYARARHRSATRVDYRAVIARGMTCHICGRDVTMESVSFDHVVPFHRGGKHVTSNVYLAHKRCNSAKGYLLVHEMAS